MREVSEDDDHRPCPGRRSPNDQQKRHQIFPVFETQNDAWGNRSTKRMWNVHIRYVMIKS